MREEKKIRRKRSEKEKLHSISHAKQGGLKFMSSNDTFCGTFLKFIARSFPLSLILLLLSLFFLYFFHKLYFIHLEIHFKVVGEEEIC
jgi:hypothetical protein